MRLSCRQLSSRLEPRASRMEASVGRDMVGYGSTVRRRSAGPVVGAHRHRAGQGGSPSGARRNPSHPDDRPDGVLPDPHQLHHPSSWTTGSPVTPPGHRTRACARRRAAPTAPRRNHGTALHPRHRRDHQRMHPARHARLIGLDHHPDRVRIQRPPLPPPAMRRPDQRARRRGAGRSASYTSGRAPGKIRTCDTRF